MASSLDKVHDVGMSENGSTYLAVNTVYDANNQEIIVEPPIEVVLEGENAHVAVTQDGFAARYHDDELREIGEGSSTLGLSRVIADIAINGKLTHGDIKPLHPSLIQGRVVRRPELVPIPTRVNY